MKKQKTMTKLMTKRLLLQGNEACVKGALTAGCSFYAGYPITPASEIMELMAKDLPKREEPLYRWKMR